MPAKIAITLDAYQAVDVLQEAFNHHVAPEIIDADQGSQFSVVDFEQAVEGSRCRLNINGIRT